MPLLPDAYPRRVDERKDPAAVAPQRSGPRRAVARWGALGVFAVVAAALLGAIWLIFQTIEAERIERAQVSRTGDVLVELRNVTRAALNAESGQRGYLITLDRRYLQSYHLGHEQYGPAIRGLRRLLGDEAGPRQRALADEIENLADAKFAEIDQSVALIEDGDLIAARRLLLSDEGQEVMERLRGAVREMEQIERAALEDAASDTARAEGRVLPLLFALLALVLITLWLGFRLSVRAARAETDIARAEALASQAEIVAEARDRADLLARELNHRVKNLFAVILAIVRMSAKDAPEAKPAVERIADRINALLTAHNVTQGAGGAEVGSLRTLIETTVRPYLTADRRVAIEGPDAELPAKQVTPLGLVLHELTTNALKYGCWTSGGLLTVAWRRDGEDLAIDWVEDCPHDGVEPSRQGFGSLLMSGAARQLRGSIERRFTPEGVRVAIRFPLLAAVESGGRAP